MESRRFVVIGAGEVGSYLARLLSQAGHGVVVVEPDPDRADAVGENLDVSVVVGNGAHLPVLQRAAVDRAEAVFAVSSSDEANLVASLLAKRLGARRTVVRVRVADDVTQHRETYEREFGADLLLSTELLTTIRILDHIRGHDTVAVEYLAGGAIQLRKVHLEEGSLLTRKPLRHVELPAGSLVVALERNGEVIVPSGSDQAAAGDDALVLALSEVIDRVERMLTAKPRQPASVVLAGGGRTGATVARALLGMNLDVTLIERQRRRAEELAANFPTLRVLCGDATDVGLLRSERVGRADTLVALTGRDEQNLMACLVGHEVGVPQVVALVERAETLHLWRRVGLVDVVAPRVLAYERIRAYIESGYEASILSRHRGAAVIERRLEAASPAAGVALAEMGAPRGLIVGAVVRGDQAFVPRGRDRLEVGDTVFLFAREEELDTVNLLFPGRDRT